MSNAKIARPISLNGSMTMKDSRDARKLDLTQRKILLNGSLEDAEALMKELDPASRSAIMKSIIAERNFLWCMTGICIFAFYLYLKPSVAEDLRWELLAVTTAFTVVTIAKCIKCTRRTRMLKFYIEQR